MHHMHGFCQMSMHMIMKMNTETLILKSRYDGLDISVLMTCPESEPEAVLQISHGMRGCKERFLPFMQYMSEHGVACVANDHRGHGMSVRNEEDRGYMYAGGSAALVDDMKKVTDWIHGRFPTVPVYLLGHSMGSLAARTYIKTRDDDISGLIVCGSPSGGAMASSGWLLSRLLCTINGGRIRVEGIQNIVSWNYNRKFASEGPEAWTCSDPEPRKAFAENPKCRFSFTANAMHALMSMLRQTYSSKGWTVSNPSMPVYFISGADDPCMRNERSFHSSVQHMADLGYTDVTSVLYSGMRHEVLNEIGKEMVWNDVLEHIRTWSDEKTA